MFLPVTDSVDDATDELPVENCSEDILEDSSGKVGLIIRKGNI